MPEVVVLPWVPATPTLCGWLRLMQPSVLDILPLTLEEVFTYEMEALGYAFGDLLPQ